MHADKEALILRLVEREKQIDALKSQVENSTHMAEQHRQSIDKLRRENDILGNQLDQRKQEIQQLVVSRAAQNFSYLQKTYTQNWL